MLLKRASNDIKLKTASDTRGVHGKIFKDLTPPHFPYYAGHYRGEPLRCLRHYEVGIRSDPRVGHTPATVPMEMEDFKLRLGNAMAAVDVHMQTAKGGMVSAEIKLVYYVEVIAAYFVEFLEIHPYANGNGHIGRMMIHALLSRIDITLTQAWSIDPRPKDSRYVDAIKRYRDGERAPLVQFIIQAI